MKILALIKKAYRDGRVSLKDAIEALLRFNNSMTRGDALRLLGAWS